MSTSARVGWSTGPPNSVVRFDFSGMVREKAMIRYLGCCLRVLERLILVVISSRRHGLFRTSRSSSQESTGRAQAVQVVGQYIHTTDTRSNLFTPGFEIVGRRTPQDSAVRVTRREKIDREILTITMSDDKMPPTKILTYSLSGSHYTYSSCYI